MKNFMSFYRYKREKTFGVCDFGAYKFYICELSDVKGLKYKGVTALPFDSINEIPYPMSGSQAKMFSAYLMSVYGGNVPKMHKIKTGWTSIFSSFYINFEKVKGGRIKGRISIGTLFGGSMKRIALEPSQVKAFADELKALYKD